MLINHDLTLADEIDALGKPIFKRKKKSPERDIQVRLFQWMEWALPRGSVAFAVKNEHAASGATLVQRQRFTQKRKAEGVRPGFPDIGILLPGETLILVEAKAPKGRLSEAQTEMHAKLRSLGFVVLVVRSVDELQAGLLFEGVPLRIQNHQP